MTEILIHILINALAIIGLHLSTQDGMILSAPARWLEARIGVYAMPLYNCPTCMASVWGVTYWICFVSTGLFYLPVYILAVSATATFLNRLVPMDDTTQP